MHCAFRRQVLRQIAPLTARTQHIHHAVDHLAHLNRAAAPAVLGGWDHGFDQRPFRISQIRWVAQPVAVVARAVLDRPHRAPLAKQVPRRESHTIRAAQVPSRNRLKRLAFLSDGHLGTTGYKLYDRLEAINDDRSIGKNDRSSLGRRGFTKKPWPRARRGGTLPSCPTRTRPVRRPVAARKGLVTVSDA